MCVCVRLACSCCTNTITQNVKCPGSGICSLISRSVMARVHAVHCPTRSSIYPLSIITPSQGSAVGPYPKALGLILIQGMCIRLRSCFQLVRTKGFCDGFIVIVNEVIRHVWLCKCVLWISWRRKKIYIYKK